MPYRRAHWYLLLLFPLTGLAFWPNYFSDMRGAPAAFHVHGATASLWILLLAGQSWTIHQRRNALHRKLGLSSFALLPMFTLGGLLVLQTMAAKFAAGTDPFYALFGARLALVDVVSTSAIPCLFYMALRWRRKVHLHARYMIVTVFFLIAPILSRLMPALPPLAITGPQDMYRFEIGVHISNLIAVLLAAALYLRAPKHGRPFLVVSALLVAQSLLFATVGKTEAWESVFVAFGTVPIPLLAAIALVAGGAAVWLGWTSPPARRHEAALPLATTAAAPDG